MKFSIALSLFLFSFIAVEAQTVSTITAGNCTDGLGQDNLGNIYCSDWGGKIVYRIDANGVSSIFRDGFTNPNGIVVDDMNHIYICDHTDNQVEKYDQEGKLIRSYTDFVSPSGIKRLPNSNNFIVVEYNTGKIKILQPNGIVTTKHSGFPLNGPAGIAVIGTTVYIASFNDRRIYRYAEDSLNFITQLPGHPGNYNFLGFLTALNDKLYATHIDGHRIYEVNPKTGLTTVFAGNGIAGGQDGAIDKATFNQPNGILADISTNTLYISEAGSKNLRIIKNPDKRLSSYKYDLSKFSISPNLAGYQLDISFPDLDRINVDIRIYNQSGIAVFYSKDKTPIEGKIQLQLDPSKFKSGYYVVTLNNQNISASKLFFKE